MLATAAMNRAATTYAQVGMETGVAAADPHKLILMLFDGAIVCVTRALHAVAAGDRAAKVQAIARAVGIIDGGLRASLDLSAGGALAAQLDGLYGYMRTQLLAASAQDRLNTLEEVKRLLDQLREAWAGIAPGASASPPQSLSEV